MARTTSTIKGSGSVLTRRSVLGGATAATALGLVGLPLRARADEGETIFETTAGKVRGRIVDGIHTFKGVPYGASTEGARFLPPRKPVPWAGIKDALEWGPRSPQVTGLNAAPGQVAPNSGEDCLVLNVWTPALDDKKRPVMFWLHGGGFYGGSGAEAATEGANLARTRDVVVITSNHRLNIFGYLDLSELGGSRFVESGNVGMLDIQLALQWVQANIGRMGGDVGNVTIFGHSGGGQKCCTVMAMPSAKGLFHRVIPQSGNYIKAVERKDSLQAARDVMKVLDLQPNQVEKLQQLPIEQLIGAFQKVNPSLIHQGDHVIRYFNPVLDGKLIPAHPGDPQGLAVSANIPLMIGGARDEAAFNTPANLDEATMRKRIDTIYGPQHTDKLLEMARQAHPGMTPAETVILLISESTRFDGSTIAERKVALGKAPAYFYMVSWADDIRKAFHGIELPFVFDNPKLIRMNKSGNPEVPALVKLMSDTWVSFARTGNPNHPGLANWPTFNAKDRPTMVFNAETKVVSDPTKTDRLMMTAIGLPEGSAPRRTVAG
jgi:para-nitrobenzyl esterase